MSFQFGHRPSIFNLLISLRDTIKSKNFYKIERNLGSICDTLKSLQVSTILEIGTGYTPFDSIYLRHRLGPVCITTVDRNHLLTIRLPILALSFFPSTYSVLSLNQLLNLFLYGTSYLRSSLDISYLSPSNYLPDGHYNACFSNAVLEHLSLAEIDMLIHQLSLRNVKYILGIYDHNDHSCRHAEPSSHFLEHTSSDHDNQVKGNSIHPSALVTVFSKYGYLLSYYPKSLSGSLSRVYDFFAYRTSASSPFL